MARRRQDSFGYSVEFGKLSFLLFLTHCVVGELMWMASRVSATAWWRGHPSFASGSFEVPSKDLCQVFFSTARFGSDWIRIGWTPVRGSPSFRILLMSPLSFSCFESVSVGFDDSGVSECPAVVAVWAFGGLISRSVTTTLSSNNVSPTNSRWDASRQSQPPLVFSRIYSNASFPPAGSHLSFRKALLGVAAVGGRAPLRARGGCGGDGCLRVGELR